MADGTWRAARWHVLDPLLIVTFIGFTIQSREINHDKTMGSGNGGLVFWIQAESKPPDELILLE